MRKEEIKKHISDISLAHLYLDDILLQPLCEYKDIFLNYKVFDYSYININLESFHIIFIELKTINKQNLKFLNYIVKKNLKKDIYIFSNDCDNIFLLKFALHFSLNKIMPLSSNNVEFEKILFDASKKQLEEITNKTQIEISKKINSFFALLMFHKNKLIFANEKAKLLFNLVQLSEIESVLFNSEDIYELIQINKKNQIEVVMEDRDGNSRNHAFYAETFANSDDKLITIIPLNKIVETDAFLNTQNRFKFIETLKDKLAQNSINQFSMSLVCINIVNYDKLIRSSGSILVHDYIKKFITKLSLYKDISQDLVQWSPHFFLFLVEEEKFENIKQELDSMHQKLIYSDIDKKISPIIISSSLRADGLTLNDIIDSLEQINSRSFSSNDFNSSDYFEINHFNEYISEDEQIKHYLQSCVGNGTSLKLLNIYKGLCINTSSKVLKIKENSYFLHCENLQGYSMKFENKTIIQSADLPHDIQADIVYVNIEKSYALLENLVFLTTSANNRQHTRVQPGIRTPVTITHKKHSYQGEIMDLSTQSIAIRFNHILSDELVSQQVNIKFKVPDSSAEEGFCYMNISGSIVHIGSIGLTKCKVVVLFNLEKPYDSYILKYMYNRQKELILELKRAVKLQQSK